ncbi:MAG: hypothetical protein GY754_10740 [bacterium]|nr:hypothetical protein [bacterium]
MFKFGIHKASQLSLKKVRGFFGKRKFISIELYRDLRESDHKDCELLQETILNRFALANGVYKRTYSNRFPEFDILTEKTIEEQFSGSTKQVIVHDLAASDFRTSFDLHNILESVFGARFHLHASDLGINVYLARDPSSKIAVVTDEEGALLQLISPPWVFNVPKQESNLYFLNHIIRSMLMKYGAKKILRNNALLSHPITINMVCNKAHQLSSSRDNFSINKYNIFEPAEKTFNRQFDIVRAMNILNKSYFSDEKIRTITSNIFHSLLPGGLLITGSNQETGSGVDGAVYKKQNNHFSLLARSHKGADADEYISAFSGSA